MSKTEQAKRPVEAKQPSDAVVDLIAALKAALTTKRPKPKPPRRKR